MEVGSTEEETTEEKDGDGRHLPKEDQEEGSGDLYLTSLGDQHLPIMHWEDLSLRIAELEKQEQQKRERAEVSPTHRPTLTGVLGLIPCVVY
jgi:hypothetical protein